MTAVTNTPSSDPSDDINAWSQSILDLENAESTQGTDSDNYKARLKAFDAKIASGMDPQELLVYFFEFINNDANSNSSQLGLQDDGIDVLAKKLGISSKGSTVSSDIQALLQNQSADPNDVKNFATYLDKTLDLLTDQGPNLGFSPTETNELISQYSEMRGLIYWKDDPDTGPKTATQPGPGGVRPNHQGYWNPLPEGQPGSTAIIDPDAPTTTGPTTAGETINFNNFADLFGSGGAQSKDVGIQSTAATGIKTMLNDFNTAATSFGSINKATDAELQHFTNIQKSTLGFESDGLHTFSDTIKVAIQNQVSR